MRPSGTGSGRRRWLAAGTALVTAFLSVVAQPAVAGSRVDTIFVSPEGRGAACKVVAPCAVGTAQDAARRAAATRREVTVVVGGGRYQLTKPLVFDARDSAADGRTVRWQAAPGARPVFTGARQVKGWTLSDAANGVFAAKVGTGFDSRQLYVDGKLAPRAQISVPSSSITLNPKGFVVNDPALAEKLRQVRDPSTMDFRAVLSFTDRYTPVAGFSGNQVTLAQPAWDNNTFGYDTVQSPFRAAQFTLQNAPQFLNAGQWYLDGADGVLYYKPAAGQDVRRLDVQLPRVESLLQIAGTVDNPVRGLEFTGLTFTGTSWLYPNSDNGYASSQSGGVVTGAQPTRPADAFTSCAVGCQGYEGTRQKVRLISGAVQVSAATRVSLRGNTFVNLGSDALGIGNDAASNGSGVGLAAQDITVTGNTFSDNAGGGIIIGGVGPDAHHPSDVRMTNKNIVVTNNSVHDNAIDYLEQAGIFATYVSGLTIAHNEVFNQPYSGVNVGWGWGMMDAGGNPVYADRGTYQYFPAYQTPTTAKDVHISQNYLYNVLTLMNDGACVYTLSAMPGSTIDGNFCRDSTAPASQYSFGLYLDEGSRFITVTNNVFIRTRFALHTNAPPKATNGDLHADTNYASSDIAFSDLGNAARSSSTNLIGLGPEIPSAASRIMYLSGLERPLRSGADQQRPPLGAAASVANPEVLAKGSTTISAPLANFDATSGLSSLAATISGPKGWKVTTTAAAPKTLRPGATATPKWTVTAPASFPSLLPQDFTVTVTYTSQGRKFTTARTVRVAPLSPVTSLSTYGSVPTRFAELGGTFTITNASSDIWGGPPQHDDQYGTVYAEQKAGQKTTATVRVAAYDQPSVYTKAGLVFRNDLEAWGRSPGYVVVVNVPSMRATLQWDANGDGYLESTVSDPSAPATGPLYLKLVRDGDTYTGYWSSDGSGWHQIGVPVTVPGVAGSQDVGMLWTSHNAGAEGTATFDSFSVSAP
ncbi:MAG: right-handed parallel beta-helix repeat-containing protein [Umezawaea sp.]